MIGPGAMTACNFRAVADWHLKPIRQRQSTTESIGHRQRIYVGALNVLAMVFLVSGLLTLSSWVSGHHARSLAACT